MPMARTGQPRAWKSTQPKSAARPRNPVAIFITVWDFIIPDAVTRTGPSLRSVSAPFLESIASLKKLVAIWMATAPPSVQRASKASNWSVSFHASTQPAQTGTMAAGRVLGRAARKQHLRNEWVTSGLKNGSGRESISFILFHRAWID